MSDNDKLFFGFRKRLPFLNQTEATECGLACLGMISGFHGSHMNMRELRSRFLISLKGSTLASLIKIASELNLNSRALKLDLENLKNLQLPCILHWDFNHFIVLRKIGKNGFVIHDPAIGVREISWKEMSDSFTGVALEVWPNPTFKETKPPKTIKLRTLLGKVSGIGESFTHIMILALALEILLMISPLFFQFVIDKVIVSADRDLLTTLATAFFIVMVLHQLIAALRSWALLYVGTTMSLQWRANTFTHLLKLPASYFEKRHVGDIVSRFGSVDTIQNSLTSSLIEGVIDGIMAVLTLGLMYVYNITLAAVATLAVCMYALARVIWYKPLRRATEDQILHSAKQSTHFLESVRGIRTIKLFQRQSERRAAWITMVVSEMNAGIRAQKLQISYRMVNGFIFGLENIVIIWLGATFVLDGIFTAGALIAFNSYKIQFGNRSSSLIDKLFELKMLRIQGERLADIVLANPEEDGDIGLSISPSDQAVAIEIEKLRFRYSEHEPYILNNVCLSVNSGESVAITGPSGCGKSTLINVLLGNLPYTEGEIRIGGIALEKYSLAERRAMIGTVLQDDVLFSGSLAENISCFDLNADMAWVIDCARSAAILPEIAAMPMGFNTLVGDMGTILSGGQKQRILLARALYKRPRILILDEATSNLDIAREREVNDAISRLTITRIIIAHRPETIATAHRILALENGNILPVNLST